MLVSIISVGSHDLRSQAILLFCKVLLQDFFLCPFALPIYSFVEPLRINCRFRSRLILLTTLLSDDGSLYSLLKVGISCDRI